MRIPSPAAVAAAPLAFLLVFATPASAQPGWGGGYGRSWGPGWGSAGGDPLLDNGPRAVRRDDAREGRVQVSRFIVPDAAAVAQLGHGSVAVSSQAGAAGSPRLEGGTQDYLPQNDRAPYEAAVVDRLVHLGYDTLHTELAAEVRVSREVLVPAESKRNPVSGTAAMEVGNRGSAYGLALNVDMTKPKSALVSTRLDARIRDKASGKVLWEGRAEIATREGDGKWTDGTIASRLADALFDDFTHPAGDGLARS